MIIISNKTHLPKWDYVICAKLKNINPLLKNLDPLLILPITIYRSGAIYGHT